MRYLLSIHSFIHACMHACIDFALTAEKQQDCLQPHPRGISELQRVQSRPLRTDTGIFLSMLTFALFRRFQVHSNHPKDVYYAVPVMTIMMLADHLCSTLFYFFFQKWKRKTSKSSNSKASETRCNFTIASFDRADGWYHKGPTWIMPKSRSPPGPDKWSYGTVEGNRF
jgi:hypothetical protein